MKESIIINKYGKSVLISHEEYKKFSQFEDIYWGMQAKKTSEDGFYRKKKVKIFEIKYWKYIMPRPDFSDPYDQIHEIIRVNHAGEYGAKRIYQEQLKYARTDHTLIKEMVEQEIVHLNYFEKKLLEKKVRPTALLFFWNHYGFLLGALSSLIGTKTAMLITQSVEEVIEKHYEQQINYLQNLHIEPELLDNITKFRLDEIEHRDTAIINDSKNAIFAAITIKAVKTICRRAIKLSKKIKNSLFSYSNNYQKR